MVSAYVGWRFGAVWAVAALPLTLVALFVAWLLWLAGARGLDHAALRRRNALISCGRCGHRQQYRDGWICTCCGADNRPRL